MALTDSSVAVTLAIKDLLDGQAGLAAVHYGDTNLFPEFPVATVESGPKSRPLPDSSTRRFRVELTTFVTILHGKIQSADETKQETEEFAEEVEKILHQDYTLGGLVIFGAVTRMDPGVSIKPSVMLRSTRLTWEAYSIANF